ncbi:MAG TPA: guanine deaminase [Candidatus Limnocylindrales bacterium]|nr:guanine deaminase [Candidatus Limnocylindrales bacterium]
MAAPQVSESERFGSPPFALRARIISPSSGGGSGGGSIDHPDGLLVVDERGRIAWVGSAADAAAPPGARDDALDLRPLVLLPGMVDLHAHLPQLPNAGLGAGLDLLTWLDRYIFPMERRFDDADAAERLAPAAFRAFAAAGTTTVLAYGAVFKASTEGAFRAAEAHGIRAILGKVMMDRITYDEGIEPSTILDRSVRESAELIERWHGADGGRLGYAVTPRFAVSCSPDMLRESAALAARTGAWWQTHVSEDPGEVEEVRRLFPEALDYVDVYDRAGGLGPRTVLAHGIHLSDRELARLVESGTRLAHCPSSNLFLASGVMPLARYLEAGLSIGLGSDVAGGPDQSIFSVMRVGAYVQTALRVVQGDPRPTLGPLDWLRMGTLAGAAALGLDDRIGSLAAGKEADLIAVDPRLTVPLRELPYDPAEVEAADVMSRLIYRTHPDMVRLAWVRGRRLDGSPGLAPGAAAGRAAGAQAPTAGPNQTPAATIR